METEVKYEQMFIHLKKKPPWRVLICLHWECLTSRVFADQDHLYDVIIVIDCWTMYIAQTWPVYI